MNAIIERQEFSRRLCQALQDANYPNRSPVHLARLFNVHYSGSGITTHAARKWILGEAIPTQEKLTVLADVCNVSPMWLRYGSQISQPADVTASDGKARLQIEEVKFLDSFRRLPPADQQIVVRLMRILSAASKGNAA